MSQKIRDIYDRAEARGTVRQRRKVRKLLAEQIVPLLLDVSGGEFLDLQDHAREQGLTTEAFLLKFIRSAWRHSHARPLGWAYEVAPASDETITLGTALKRDLGLEPK